MTGYPQKCLKTLNRVVPSRIFVHMSTIAYMREDMTSSRKHFSAGHSGSFLLSLAFGNAKMKVTPGMLMKTKEAERQVPRAGYQVSGKMLQAASPLDFGEVFRFLTAVSCIRHSKMKVTPGMLMKTKESEERRGLGCRERGNDERGFKIEDSRCGTRTPYDGITPEGIENNDASALRSCLRRTKCG